MFYLFYLLSAELDSFGFKTACNFSDYNNASLLLNNGSGHACTGWLDTYAMPCYAHALRCTEMQWPAKKRREWCFRVCLEHADSMPRTKANISVRRGAMFET